VVPTELIAQKETLIKPMDFHSSSRCIADRLKYDFIFDEIFGPNHFAAKKFR
jgi:hypothetical protein